MDKKFKKIFNDTELTNKTFIEEYLETSFRQRKAKKDFKLYINICKIYDHYPKTVEDILDNIPELGYYKDYFYIFMFSRNDALNEYILNLVVIQLTQDVDALKNNGHVSTLGKWLPRENHKINSKSNFIDKFCEKFYPGVEQMAARRKYRKLKTNLNNKIGTLEAKVCTKQFDQIDFNKVSYKSLERNMETLLKHEECKEKLEEHELTELKRLELHQLVKEMLSDKHKSELIQKVWSHNRFVMEIPYMEKQIGKAVCFIDLSQDSFSHDLYFHSIGMAILINEFSVLDNKIYICNNGGHKDIKLEGSVVEQAQSLMKQCMPLKELKLEEIYELSQKLGGKTIIVVSNKDINYEYFENKKVNLLHFTKKNYDNYKITYYNGDKVKHLVRYNDKLTKNLIKYAKEKKNVREIIVESEELHDYNQPLKIIFALFLLWVFVWLCYYL